MIRICQGEAVYSPGPPSSSFPSPSSPVSVSSVPVVTTPIRTRPSLPRSERIIKISRVPSTEEERFIARPTKVIPSVLKLAKIGEKRLLETARSSKVTPASTSAGPVVKKPISAFKSIPSPTPVPKPSSSTPLVKSKPEETEKTPVYVPR